MPEVPDSEPRASASGSSVTDRSFTVAAQTERSSRFGQSDGIKYIRCCSTSLSRTRIKRI